MKPNTQTHITPIASGIAVRGPYSAPNNEAYKSVGGVYDRSGRRWILPDNDNSWELLHELYGTDSQIVVAEVERSHLTTTGNQTQLVGYLVAQWDPRKGCIRLGDGVELVTGEWDDATSASLAAPHLKAGDAVFRVTLRQDFALKNSLKIITELGEEHPRNPFALYSNSDLQVELEDRGYKVEPMIC